MEYIDPGEPLNHEDGGLREISRRPETCTRGVKVTQNALNPSGGAQQTGEDTPFNDTKQRLSVTLAASLVGTEGGLNGKVTILGSVSDVEKKLVITSSIPVLSRGHKHVQQHEVEGPP